MRKMTPMVPPMNFSMVSSRMVERVDVFLELKKPCGLAGWPAHENLFLRTKSRRRGSGGGLLTGGHTGL
jgi:hypothetical protein